MKYFLTIDKIFLYRVLQSFLPLLGGVGGGLTLLVLGEGEGGEDPPPHLLQLGLLLHPGAGAGAGGGGGRLIKQQRHSTGRFLST